MSHNDRKERGKSQNLYLIERLAETNDLQRSYIIMGSSGNVYTVMIKQAPTCTCPDFKSRGKRCKHIYFVLVRIMKVTNEDKVNYTDDDLTKMFMNIPAITNNLLADNHIKNKYNKINNKEEDNIVQKKSTDDLCPICLDDLENGTALDYCKFSCGKSVHIECFNMWTLVNGQTCVFCRGNWNDISKTDVNGYINLLKN